jgi:hypothetical protein
MGDGRPVKEKQWQSICYQLKLTTIIISSLNCHLILWIGHCKAGAAHNDCTIDELLVTIACKLFTDRWVNKKPLINEAYRGSDLASLGWSEVTARSIVAFADAKGVDIPPGAILRARRPN